MRKLLTLFILLYTGFAYGQKEDYVWLAGYESSDGYPTLPNNGGFGISKLDFNYSPRSITYDSLGMEFSRTCITYSDTNGHLLFYSNGIKIHNKWDEFIDNGDSLNAGYLIYDWDSTIANGPDGGLRTPQVMICIPVPDNSGQFLIFHSFLNIKPDSSSFWYDKLLVTYLDMNSNNGHGKVIYKNQPIISDLIGWPLAAVRHGNGKDWWMLIRKSGSNCFYRALINHSGVHLMTNQTCAGLLSTDLSEGDAAGFSPDGTKYATIGFSSGLFLYDFDRCTGIVSNPQHLFLPQLKDSLWLSGLCFSPNSRFLYTAVTQYCYQFDTWSSNVWASIDTVATPDTLLDELFIPASYQTPQLAADGKIYITNGSTLRNYHVIDSPDIKGPGSAFRKHGVITPTYQHNVPNFQNYRLGRLLGSSCDTLTSILETSSGKLDITVYPNPAQDYFIVDYGHVDWSLHDHLDLKVMDVAGRTIYAAALPEYSAIHRIPSPAFAQGMYLIQIEGNGAAVAIKRIIKQ